MMIDWHNLFEHYPYFLVSRERIIAAQEMAQEIGLDTGSSVDERRAQIRYWVGGAALGYEVLVTGEAFIHPMYLEADEKPSWWDPGPQWQHLKWSFSTETKPLIEEVLEQRKSA